MVRTEENGEEANKINKIKGQWSELPYSLGRKIFQVAREPMDLDIVGFVQTHTTHTLAHIWADHSEDIPKDLVEIHKDLMHMLGNLTIASKSWNSSWGPKPFHEKKEEYTNSSLRIQRELAQFESGVLNSHESIGGVCVENLEGSLITDKKKILNVQK